MIGSTYQKDVGSMGTWKSPRWLFI